MQNDMLKNNIAPWQENGRWYKITLDNISGSWVYNDDESDFKGCSISTYGNITGDGPTFKQINDIKIQLYGGNVASANADTNYYRIRIRQTVTTNYMRIQVYPTAPAECETKLVIFIHGVTTI